MKKLFSFFIVGALFGVILSKSEAISWFRIFEMFRFESFHMFGLLGTAVALGVTVLYLLKQYRPKAFSGALLEYSPMTLSIKRHLLAGSVFGLGWALIGSCPGPMYILLGHGFAIMAVVIASGIMGALVYGMVRRYLPH